MKILVVDDNDINLEFLEVLNAFPILKKKLIEMEIDFSDLKENENIIDYFTRKSYEKNEINILLRTLNRELSQHFKKSEQTNKIEIEEKTTLDEEEKQKEEE